MTRKALARAIAAVLFKEPATRRGAGAAPTRRAARILAGCFVARRSKTTAGIFPPRAAHPAKIRSSAAIRASDLVLSPTNPLFPHRVKLGKFSAMNPIAWFREKGRQLLQLKDTNHAIALGTAIG